MPARMPILLSIFLMATVALGHDLCPYGEEWDNVKKICYKESHDELTFLQGISYCISRDFRNGPGANLMPVGQLRNFKNRYDRHGHHHLKVDFEHSRGPFHVNGVKTPEGEWREYPSGNLVPLHHFPHFKALEGEPGDTLKWNPEDNELLIDDDDSHHHVLCYRPSIEQECEHCIGYEFGRECNNAGDCMNGICVCDNAFNGTLCQLQTKNNAALLIIGNPTSAGSSNAMLYNFETGTFCNTSAVPTGTSSGVGTFFEGHPYYCNLVNKDCYAFSKKLGLWLGSGDLGVPRVGGGFGLVPDEDSEMRIPKAPGNNYGWNDDTNWFATGGAASAGGANTATTEVSDGHGWEKAENEVCDYNIMMPTGIGLNGQCIVQINAYETALIGGSINATTPSYNIYVFNSLTSTWRIAATLNSSVINAGCSLITDPLTGHRVVMIAGGTASGANTASTWLWDPITNSLTMGPNLPAPVSGSNLLPFTDSQDLIVINGVIYVCSAAAPCTQLASNANIPNPSTTIIIPKNSMQCI